MLSMCIFLYILFAAAVVLDFFFIFDCHVYKLNMTDVKSNHHFYIRAHFSIIIILFVTPQHAILPEIIPFCIKKTILHMDPDRE